MMEAIGMNVDLPAVEPMEIYCPGDHIEVTMVNTDVEMMEVDVIKDKMEVDEDIPDIRHFLGDGMNTQQQKQVSPFLRVECCANVEMKYQTEIVNRGQRIHHPKGQLQNSKMIHESEIAKLQERCEALEMDLKKSECHRMVLESAINNKNEKIAFLSSQLELKSIYIGELMSDFDAKNNELSSMNTAISILIQEKQDYSQQSVEQRQQMASRIAKFQQELRFKESKINEMLMEQKADFLKLGKMEKQIEDLNKKNQILQIENLRQAERNEMERKIIHRELSSTQNNMSPSSNDISNDVCDLDFVASIPLPCEDLQEVEYVKGSLASKTNNQSMCTNLKLNINLISLPFIMSDFLIM